MYKILNYFFPQQSTEEEVPQDITQPNTPSTTTPTALSTTATTTVKIVFDEGVRELKYEDVVGVPEAFMLHNVVSENECKQFLDVIEQIGASKTPDQPKETKISECKFWRAPMDVMMPIWHRVQQYFPDTVEEEGKTWQLARSNPMNEKFRFYVYDAEWTRARHFAGAFLRNNPNSTKRDMSHFTFLIYLNEGFDGGETTFYPGGTNSLSSATVTHKEVRVNPKMGSALVFRHTGVNQPLHEGSVHHSPGIKKCLIRSDIMYSE
jgi:hypothetical protein